MASECPYPHRGRSTSHQMTHKLSCFLLCALLCLGTLSSRGQGAWVYHFICLTVIILLLRTEDHRSKMTDSSKVLHIRNVGADISENDLLQLVQPFGAGSKIVMLRAKNQALLQMQDVSSAVKAMHYYTTVQPSVRGWNVYLQFSSYKELTITDQGGQNGHKLHQELQANRILLITILNPLYHITVDVLHQVFSSHGFIEKIVTFQKSAGLQALLQYASHHSALQAKSSLQGQSIYDGCCTLDIQFSNLLELQVHYNNERTRDFTNPSLPAEQTNHRHPSQGNTKPLFGDSGNVYSIQPGGPGQAACQQLVGLHKAMGSDLFQVPIGHAAAAAKFGGVLPPGITGTNEKSTLLVSNLSAESWDADKLFNLFSNYGNIIHIKIFHNKTDHALVQMGDCFQAEVAISFLKGVSVFGRRLEVTYSKHAQINPSPDTRDYSTSNLNRFNRNATKNYRHCCSPTKMIHVSCLPSNVTEKDIMVHLFPHGNIVDGRIFEVNGKRQALMQFENEELATEALVCKHASLMRGSMIRLAFSKLSTV